MLLAALAGAAAMIAAGASLMPRAFRSSRAVAVALVVLAAVFITPLCAMSSALFSARALHHIILVSAAAPLLALGFSWRERGAGWGATMALIHALVFWGWHAPAAYAAALSSDLIYWLMQATILGSAVMLWTAIVRSSPLTGIGLSAASMIQMGLLGALLTFGQQAVYAPHFGTTAAWGLTPLDDQQLAGVLMWVLGGLSFFAATLWHGLRVLTPRPQPAC